MQQLKSNSQLNKLKSAIKNEAEIVFRILSNRILVILMMTLIFHINYYQPIEKLQVFLNLLQIIYRLISSYQNLSYLK